MQGAPIYFKELKKSNIKKLYSATYLYHIYTMILSFYIHKMTLPWYNIQTEHGACLKKSESLLVCE